MNCQTAMHNLGLLIDGELSGDLRREVESHLESCPSCRAELRSLHTLADGIAAGRDVDVPAELWPAIETSLDHPAEPAPRVARPTLFRFLRKPLAAAAAVALVLGGGILGGVALFETATPVQASTIDFAALLDAIPLDARTAFRDFIDRYRGVPISAEDAHADAPALNFEVPDQLPGGFQRTAVYALRFGGQPGIAAEYVTPDGEFLGALFHPPVRREDFGTHRDYPCAIGKHRGHTVRVGDWTMVHLTDPTTCHCVLSRLNPQADLLPIMTAIAPRSGQYRPDADSAHVHHHDAPTSP